MRIIDDFVHRTAIITIPDGPSHIPHIVGHPTITPCQVSRHQTCRMLPVSYWVSLALVLLKKRTHLNRIYWRTVMWLYIQVQLQQNHPFDNEPSWIWSWLLVWELINDYSTGFTTWSKLLEVLHILHEPRTLRCSRGQMYKDVWTLYPASESECKGGRLAGTCPWIGPRSRTKILMGSRNGFEEPAYVKRKLWRFDGVGIWVLNLPVSLTERRSVAEAVWHLAEALRSPAWLEHLYIHSSSSSIMEHSFTSNRVLESPWSHYQEGKDNIECTSWSGWVISSDADDSEVPATLNSFPTSQASGPQECVVRGTCGRDIAS